MAEVREAVEASRPLGDARDTHAAGRISATDTLATAYATAVPALRVLDRLVPRLVKDASFVDDYVNLHRIPGA